MKISNNPPKGTYDWTPDEFRVRKYIFDTWRRVCKSFGFEEYLTPLVEYAEVYRAKSGEDVGGKELTTFKDRAERELAIRPEMTPSVTRMVSKSYNSMQKPIKYFSIANFFRNEKPQRGRNREFWQLNFDIFGDSSISSDLEVLQIALEIMLAFNPPKNSFKLYLNNRKLIESILELKVGNGVSKTEVIRTLDKVDKLSREDLEKKLLDLGVSEDNVSFLYDLFTTENEELFLKSYPDIEQSEGYKETRNLISLLESLGYGDYVDFKPSLMRGFDYYDGMVFEVFDLNPENTRAMFGGGRYNGLANIFGIDSFSAVGAAPGDETLKLFLESWNLTEPANKAEPVYFLPLLDETLLAETLNLAKKLRSEGKIVVQSAVVERLGKSLDTANKKGYSYVVIFGEYEKNDGIYKVKDMEDGTEEEFSF